MDRRLGCTRAMRPSTRCSACASASSAACSRTVSIAHCKNTSSACVPTLLGLVGVRRSVRCSAQCAGHGLGEWYNNTMAQAWLTSLAAQAWVSASTWSEGSLRLLQPSQTCSSGFAGSPATGYYAGMDTGSNSEKKDANADLRRPSPAGSAIRCHDTPCTIVAPATGHCGPAAVPGAMQSASQDGLNLASSRRAAARPR